MDEQSRQHLDKLKNLILMILNRIAGNLYRKSGL